MVSKNKGKEFRMKMIEILGGKRNKDVKEEDEEELQPPLGRRTPERKELSGGGTRKFLREGEIDAIVTVIELDIIAITIIIISTIITAVITAGHPPP
ncbi:hypothetical protein QYE76_035627 [Lolium multiflorum]|uniref:Uncharacterized protein n=1 Tax=Lolium multiflorum TaxID=4521 RepID=A0AAD8R2X2_LOLMU|nr:hypothetical protein QYE76_035627 [Lolium multiflorum]